MFVPFAYTLPAYARPALATENELARAPNPRAINFADQIELRGYDIDARAVRPGEALRVTLYWRARAAMDESYRVFAHLVGSGDQRGGGADVIPARGAFPTVYWKPGDALRDVVTIPVAASAPPGRYALQVGLYPVGKVNQPLTTRDGEDRVTLDTIKIAPRELLTFAPRMRVGALFADTIELIGYDAEVTQDQARLILYWRARAALDRDYTVFVHALDARDQIIAQADQQPQAGNYPTSIWSAGEQVRDEHLLRGASHARRIILGLYRADTGERLLVDGSDHIEIVLSGATP